MTRQRLGQHFLEDEEVVATIIGRLNPLAGETIVEIGPGTGALTAPLKNWCAERGCRLIAIERDEALAQLHGDIEVIGGDALVELPKIAQTMTNYKIVGNIPYYITGALLRVIGELAHKPTLAVLMVQKEVAERVSAAPPAMNLLAAATQIWSEVETVVAVSRKSFNPAPEVDSAVIALTPAARLHNAQELERYYRTIKAAFKQPRKKLSNNIAKELLMKTGLSPDLRAQNLSLSELIALSMIY